MAKIHEFVLELTDHSLYSPDLVPADVVRFSGSKVPFTRQRFSSNEEAITCVNAYFAEQNANNCFDRLGILAIAGEITLNSEYAASVEKEEAVPYVRQGKGFGFRQSFSPPFTATTVCGNETQSYFTVATVTVSYCI
ncbi:hypothetical protein Trydic_g19017 [Trypoxylus dichotomus]